MLDSKKPIKIVFEPGCFDDFEGTQEELDAFVKEITDFIHSDEFMADVSDAAELDDDEAEEIKKIFNNHSKLIH